MDLLAQIGSSEAVGILGGLCSPAWGVFSVVLGAFIGSFLNVVIYRVPRRMDVNKPSRSFCPGCKKQIPWYRNIPIFTWLLQRGRCAGCDSSIPMRYLIVEMLTTLLFFAMWWFYAGPAMFLGWLFVALLVAIAFIDGEHYIIPVNWCWVAIPIAIVFSYFHPALLFPAGWGIEIGSFTKVGGGNELLTPKLYGPAYALVGFLLGYIGLVVVVIFGKIAFGKRKVSCDGVEKWFLKEPQSDEEQLQFVLGEEAIDWGEVFYRKSDRIELKGGRFLVDEKAVSGDALTIREREVQIGDQTYQIEQLKSLSGEATELVIPREAMGAGDPPFLGMIGAFLGPLAVIFTLLSSCLYAIVAAILGRIGYGKPLPFGPFLALGALTWMLGGYRLMQLYLSWVMV